MESSGKSDRLTRPPLWARPEGPPPYSPAILGAGEYDRI